MKYSANHASSVPTTFSTASRERMARLGVAAEQALESLDMAAVRQEHDQMVVGLDERVMVRHDDVLAANDRDDAGTLRQRQLLQAPPDEPGALARSAHHR